ncbi:MAG: hypothetical protein OQJ89_08115 [Kangiellaceae bacterium]|nr:hypothetical protein [Kangiellaceae bacterium]MCW9016912.1 hypothetical protein [Kangiellaceae bacterium]
MTIINQFSATVNAASLSDKTELPNNEGASEFELLVGVKAGIDEGNQQLESGNHDSTRGTSGEHFEAELADLTLTAKEENPFFLEGRAVIDVDPKEPLGIDFSQTMEGLKLKDSKLGSLVGELFEISFSNEGLDNKLTEKVLELVGLLDSQTVGLVDNQYTRDSSPHQHNNLQVYVPLSSVAVGKLSQVSGAEVFEMQSAQLRNESSKEVQISKANQNIQARSITVENFVEKLRKADTVTSNNATSNTSLFSSVESEFKRTSSSQYASLVSQSNSDWLSKKLSLIESQDELSVWYRDYSLDEKELSNKLIELRGLFEQNRSIKQIGINGKIVFTRGEEGISKGDI